MNLKVKDEYRVCPDPFNEWMCLRNAFTILDAIDPSFDGDVIVLMKTEGNINFLYVSIPSASLNWGVSIDSVNENWQIGTGMTIAEAKTRIRELTSPKVDQPAPDEPKAAEIQWEEPQIDSETNLHFILGGGYKVEQFMSGGKIYYRAQFHDRPWDLGYLGQHDSFEDGQAACQAHKQRQLKQLL